MPRKQEERDFILKVRTYSEDIMGYRICVAKEIIYVINELYLTSSQIIVDMLITLSEEYPEYGCIVIKKGFKPMIDRNYRYNSKIDDFSYEISDSKVISMSDYHKWRTLQMLIKGTKRKENENNE